MQQLNMGEDGQTVDNVEQLIDVLRKEEKRKLTNVKEQNISEDVRESQFEVLTLEQYVVAKENNCRIYHQDCKQGCQQMVRRKDCAEGEVCCFVKLVEACILDCTV